MKVFPIQSTHFLLCLPVQLCRVQVLQTTLMLNILLTRRIILLQSLFHPTLIMIPPHNIIMIILLLLLIQKHIRRLIPHIQCPFNHHSRQQYPDLISRGILMEELNLLTADPHFQTLLICRLLRIDLSIQMKRFLQILKRRIDTKSSTTSYRRGLSVHMLSIVTKS